jgi:hypothetical protein
MDNPDDFDPDAFDPDFHTPEEFEAEYAEYLAWVERRQMRADLLDAQDQLEKLAHLDPVGLVFFGDDDKWIDDHLYPGRPK